MPKQVLTFLLVKDNSNSLDYFLVLFRKDSYLLSYVVINTDLEPLYSRVFSYIYCERIYKDFHPVLKTQIRCTH